MRHPTGRQPVSARGWLFFAAARAAVACRIFFFRAGRSLQIGYLGRRNSCAPDTRKSVGEGDWSDVRHHCRTRRSCDGIARNVSHENENIGEGVQGEGRTRPGLL